MYVNVMLGNKKGMKMRRIYPALTGSKTPPQNLARAKKLGGDQLPVKARLVQLIISGDEQNPH